MGVSGGAVIPPIQAAIHDRVNVNISFIVPLVSYSIVLFYGLVGSKWIRYAKEDFTDKSITNEDLSVDVRGKDTLQN
jgi:fucose permease